MLMFKNMTSDKNKELAEEECLELISQASELHQASREATNKKTKKELSKEAESLEQQAEDIMNKKVKNDKD